MTWKSRASGGSGHPAARVRTAYPDIVTLRVTSIGAWNARRRSSLISRPPTATAFLSCDHVVISAAAGTGETEGTDPEGPRRS